MALQSLREGYTLSWLRQQRGNLLALCGIQVFGLADARKVSTLWNLADYDDLLSSGDLRVLLDASCNLVVL